MKKTPREIIRETVQDLRKLDMTSLLIIKSGAEMLRARDSMDQGKQIDPEPEKEVV